MDINITERCKLMSRPAAARMLGISRRSLNRLIITGAIPVVSWGAQVRMSVAALLKFAEGKPWGTR